MIKFICSDLDGTLLDKNGELPKDIFPLILRLADCGIIFAPASGRQYANIAMLFAPVADKLLFVCENGALVKRQNKTLRLAPLSPSAVKTAIDAIRQTDGLYPIVCCPDTAYFEDIDEPFYSRATPPYLHRRRLSSLDEMLGKEPVCKISVFDVKGAKDHAMRVLPPLLSQDSSLTLSGASYCDVCAKSATKGAAIKEIQTSLGFRPDECMAFGDHMNDIGMFDVCAHSRAVANAYPTLLQRAEAVVPSNEEGGVLQEIKKLLQTRETRK
jgi:hypothetical protein